jgi:hypothetical protein
MTWTGPYIQVEEVKYLISMFRVKHKLFSNVPT